jgi:hypothetical protein
MDGSSLATSPFRVRPIHRVIDRRLEENWALDAWDAHGFVAGGVAAVPGVAGLSGRRLTRST